MLAIVLAENWSSKPLRASKTFDDTDEFPAYMHANVTIKTDYNYIITLLHTCTAYSCFL